MIVKSAAVAVMLLFAGLASYGGDLISSLKQRIDESAGVIDGIYEMPGDGAVFAVVSASGRSGRWDLIVIDSPDFSVEPGTPFGYAVAGASPDVFDARLYEELRSDRKVKSHDFALRLGDDGRLSFEAYRNSRRVSFWRWIPYLFRVTVIEENNRPKGLDGAVRIYPPGVGASPRSL